MMSSLGVQSFHHTFPCDYLQHNEDQKNLGHHSEAIHRTPWHYQLDLLHHMQLSKKQPTNLVYPSGLLTLPVRNKAEIAEMLIIRIASVIYFDAIDRLYRQLFKCTAKCWRIASWQQLTSSALLHAVLCFIYLFSHSIAPYQVTITIRIQKLSYL